MTVTKDEIQSSPVFTNEMKALLVELREIIAYARDAGRPLQRISLSRKQWEPIRKDRKRSKWDVPRGCGLIHYASEEPTFDGVRLGAPSDRELQGYLQEDLFHGK